MNVTSTHPRLENILRYLSAYAWYLFFIVLCVAIIFALRSDIFVLGVALSVPQDITHFIYVWGIYPLFLPFIGVVAGLEPYLHQAAQKRVVRQRALKVLAIEGGIGLLVFAALGVLALLGYPPTL